jgi:uracil-DNA glycosylase
MKADERREIWDSLSVVEDWLGGFRREREEPDFEAAAAVAEAAAAAAAARSAAPGGAREGARGAAPTAAPLPENDSLEAVAEEVRACRLCRLCETRGLAVPGQGPNSPLALVVGEGPGAEEDASGLPFVGPAGALLDKMLLSIGLSREDNCFIANVVKCRPPQNRDPEADEREACMPYLRRQVALLRPKAILCVGRVAANAVLGSAEGVGRLRGYWREFDGFPVLVSYHPSALLRDESLKRPAWEDLKAFRAKLTSLS